jgi:hypothetical protein
MNAAGLEFNPEEQMIVYSEAPDSDGAPTTGDQLAAIIESINDELAYAVNVARLPSQGEGLNLLQIEEVLQFSHMLFDWRDGRGQSAQFRTAWDMTCREAIAALFPLLDALLKTQEQSHKAQTTLTEFLRGQKLPPERRLMRRINVTSDCGHTEIGAFCVDPEIEDLAVTVRMTPNHHGGPTTCTDCVMAKNRRELEEYDRKMDSNTGSLGQPYFQE